MANVLRSLAAGLIVLAFGSASGSAGEPPPFFKGKTVSIHVGSERDSVPDRYTRALAHHLGRHLPGNPAVDVENHPSAAGLTLANRVYRHLPQDGTVIASVGRRVAIEPLFGDSQAEFDGSKFNWLGSMNNDVDVCAVWHTAPIIFWQDLVDRSVVMGGGGLRSASHIAPLVLNNVLRTRMALITGYPDDSYIKSAIERGEVDGRCGWPWSAVKSDAAKWLAQKKIRILAQMSAAQHPDLPDIPLILDFARTKRDLEVLKLIFASRLWSRSYLVGPAVPRARVAALRLAFAKTMKDRRFLREVKRQALDLAWVDGATVQKAIEELYRFPKETVAAAVKASADRANTQLSRAVIPVKTAAGTITKLRGDGRAISWAGDGRTGDLRISENRTKILIYGEKSQRTALKTGMNCEFTYRAALARIIDCR